jgi:hypothetical protein
VAYTEKSIDLSWDSVPGAVGYHLYTSPVPATPLSSRRRVNQSLVTSGTHFTYLWDIRQGKRVRAIKGKLHNVVLTAVFETQDTTLEGPPSAEIDNYYFKGFDRMISRHAIEPVLREEQTATPLPVRSRRNTADGFIEFMEGPGALLQKLIADSLDPEETGGCVPLSTILLQLLNDWGLKAHRIEGTFIKEFHSFVVINLDGVEYVLDVSADQFVPGVAPVLVPRDFCHLDGRGKLAREGVPVYVVGKIFAPEQTWLRQGKTSDVYRSMYETVRASREAATQQR